MAIKHAAVMFIVSLFISFSARAQEMSVRVEGVSSGACMVICDDLLLCKNYDYDRQSASCLIDLDTETTAYIFKSEFCALPSSPNWVISYDDANSKWTMDCPPARANRTAPAVDAPLVTASRNFQNLAAEDFLEALKEFASDNGRRKLSSFNSAIWKAKTSQLGWVIYFNSAIRVMGQSPDRMPIVTYYNPFSDVLLFTLWRSQGETFRIVDAEMILGDFIRQPRQKPSYIPPLLRLMASDGNWSAAAGFTTAYTTLALERRLANMSPQDWRQGLSIFNGPDALLDLNTSGVSLLLNAHMVNLGQYIEPHTANAKLARTRKIVSRTISQLASGRIDEALQSAQSRTPPPAEKALRSLPANWFKGLSVSIAASHQGNYIVFLTPAETTSVSLSLTVLNSDEGSNLEQISLIDFQGFYASVKKLQRR